MEKLNIADYKVHKLAKYQNEYGEDATLVKTNKAYGLRWEKNENRKGKYIRVKVTKNTITPEELPQEIEDIVSTHHLTKE